MELPPSFKQQGTEGKVLPLRRSLYSLKQSARVWNLVATKVVGEIVRPTHVFSLEKKGIMQLSSVSPELTYRVRQQLSGYFKIKGLGNAPPPNQHWQGHQLSALTSSRRASVPPRQSGGRASVRSTDHSGDITTNVKQRAYKHDSRRSCGALRNGDNEWDGSKKEAQVEREEGGSFLLHQAGKICHLIKEHGLLDAKSIATPMETNFLSSTAEESVVLFENVQYRRAVGFLLLFSNGITARHCIRCWSIMSACRVTDSV
ncbi:hypothetical protein M514_09017 [Trichuris suis]|uniref:Reverse transcriptase Ty1/copia-type domain-containing protein n=1 Tax=Trichuris suis TaxID=68888 RepID=A0A085MZ83_9BILA|nr:hypothetical protein M514_09017 [Trichuris suis]